MTPEQMMLFVREAQAGVACGLEYPFEWYVNACRTLMNTTYYPDIPKREEEIAEAFLAFFRGTASHPDDPVLTWTIDDMHEACDEWYARARARRVVQFRVKGSDGGSGWRVIPESEREPWYDIEPGKPMIFGNGWGTALELETRVKA